MIYFAGKVCVPTQLVIKKDASSIPDAVERAGLRFPIGMRYAYCFFVSDVGV